MSAGMQLDEHDRGSATWEKFQAYCNGRLAVLRQQNDTDLSPEATAKVRGRIAEIQRFLRAGEPAREVVAGDD